MFLVCFSGETRLISSMAVVASYPSEKAPFAVIYSRLIGAKTRYEVRWRADGKRKRKVFTVETDAHALAQQLCANIKANSGRYHTITTDDWLLLQKAKRLGLERLDEALTQHTAVGVRRATVADLRERFIRFYDDRAKRTRGDIVLRFRAIEHAFGGRYVDSLTTEEIETWWRQLPGSLRNRNNYLTALTTFLNQAKAWEYLPHDRDVASARVRRVRAKKREPGILAPDQLGTILRHIRADMLPYIALGAFAGLRPSEISGIAGERDGLLWSDIDLAGGHIRIRRDVAGKTARPRVIDLHPTLAEWLAPFAQGGKKTVAYRNAARILTDANLEGEWIVPWPQDGLRHSFASYYYAMSRDLKATAHQSGNSEAIVLAHYNNPRSREEAELWFALTPAKVGRPGAGEGKSGG